MVSRHEHKEFGEFISNMRNTIGWTVNKLGKYFDTTGDTVNKWEKGKFGLQFDPTIIEEQLRELVKNELHKKRMKVLSK